MSAQYLTRVIEKGQDGDLILIELDTPGGLDESMRQIIKSELSSRAPICVYVAPSGARDASAGVFITLAANIAAMSPGTNIGAAHPVSMGGGKMDEEMKAKVENDAVAYIKSIAKKRGRNVKWAENAVRKSVSITAEEALKKGVINLIAENRDALLKKLDGWEAETAEGKTIISTKDKKIIEVPQTFRERFFSNIANPNIAYLLLIIGIYGLIFEFSHPGAFIPGIAGTISLVLAFFSLQLLPINYAGVALIVLGAIFFVLEALTPTYGPLAIGGVVSTILGSLMLIRSEAQSVFQISRPLILTVVILVGGFLVFALSMAFRAMRRKPTTGKRGLLGKAGKVREKIMGEGTVFIEGEIWKAESDEVIEPGEKVVVIGTRGLTLKVKRIKDEFHNS
jgi:membrane-bound serine protease (ClpP class)